MVEQALDTSEDVDPKGQIEQAEAALYRVAEEGGGEGSVKTFAQATRLAVQMAEKALNTGGGLSGSLPASTASTPRPAAFIIPTS
jgi:replicative DNA helicase